MESCLCVLGTVICNPKGQVKTATAQLRKGLTCLSLSTGKSSLSPDSLLYIVETNEEFTVTSGGHSSVAKPLSSNEETLGSISSIKREGERRRRETERQKPQSHSDLERNCPKTLGSLESVTSLRQDVSLHS